MGNMHGRIALVLFLWSLVLKGVSSIEDSRLSIPGLLESMTMREKAHIEAFFTLDFIDLVEPLR